MSNILLIFLSHNGQFFNVSIHRQFGHQIVYR